jgi:hypothetical protein
MGNDAKSLFSVIAVALLLMGGAAVWYSQGLGNDGKQQGGGWSFWGEAKPAAEERERICPVCKGEGKHACGRCGGQGKLDYIGKGINWCNVCNGSCTQACSLCKGKGIVSDEDQRPAYGKQQPTSLKWGGGKNR